MYIKTTANNVNICHTDIPETKGMTYITRGEVWLNRYQYKGYYRNIDNTRKLKALIREGQYCFPGGYAIIPFTSNGEAVCLDCIKENLSSCLWSIHNNVNDDWRIIGLDTYYGMEDNGETICSNCGKNWENI
jgi:hypothetical protein